MKTVALIILMGLFGWLTGALLAYGIVAGAVHHDYARGIFFLFLAGISSVIGFLCATARVPR